jgi:hypothetical protein
LDENPEGSGKINRVTWYALQLANELPAEAVVLNPRQVIKDAGVYYFYFDNSGGQSWKPKFRVGKGKITACMIRTISADFTYSSAGQTGFWDKDSEMSCEIKRIEQKQSGRVQKIPANAFGYMKITVL